MKQGLNSSSTRAYAQQLVVPRVVWGTITLPKYVWILMVVAGMGLLCGAAVIREREGLRNAQTANQFLKTQVQEAQVNNLLIRRELKSVRENKEVMVRKAQQQLNYLRPNEIAIVVK